MTTVAKNFHVYSPVKKGSKPLNADSLLSLGMHWFRAAERGGWGDSLLVTKSPFCPRPSRDSGLCASASCALTGGRLKALCELPFSLRGNFGLPSRGRSDALELKRVKKAKISSRMKHRRSGMPIAGEIHQALEILRPTRYIEVDPLTAYQFEEAAFRDYLSESSTVLHLGISTYDTTKLMLARRRAIRFSRTLRNSIRKEEKLQSATTGGATISSGSISGTLPVQSGSNCVFENTVHVPILDQKGRAPENTFRRLGPLLTTDQAQPSVLGEPMTDETAGSLESPIPSLVSDDTVKPVNSGRLAIIPAKDEGELEQVRQVVTGAPEEGSVNAGYGVGQIETRIVSSGASNIRPIPNPDSLSNIDLVAAASMHWRWRLVEEGFLEPEEGGWFSVNKLGCVRPFTHESFINWAKAYAVME